jgi:[acyl-carrier-protein] S-malonyltransferase
MGRELAEAFPEAALYFQRADEILGMSLSQLCFDGPEEELIKTENQQPAIFLVSVATLATLRNEGIAAAAAAGHSLGEYSALVAAQALDFEQGLRLTRRRGELMAEVAGRTGGVMAAVLGLPQEIVEQACRDASSLGVVEAANYNSPTQLVISGEEPAVRRAIDLLGEAGARKIVELPVSAPFHCRLMAPLAAIFGPRVEDAEIVTAVIPVVANVTADFEYGEDIIRRNLIEQLDSPVRWTASIRRLIADGFDTFVEVGPGKVLTGLMRQIDPTVNAMHTSDVSSLRNVLATLAPA